MPAGPPSLLIEGLRFAWPRQPELLAIERFELAHGERLFLFGPSGSGKSTLLNLIAGTLRPAHGTICIAGEPISGISASARDRLRADRIGVVFQQFNLLPYLSVSDNVLLGCRFSPRRRQRAIARDGSLPAACARLLAALGLGQAEFAQRPAATLSVGQQQRVAVARALIGAPELIICDEPTSALDADARAAFLALLFDECAAAGSGLLFVSHDRALAAKFGSSRALDEFASPTGASA